jgi:hypothetical protein
MSSPDDYPADRPDLRILDSEPWRQAGQPVDQLIGLQQQAFVADLAGNHHQFGTVVMAMSQAERDIGNHTEAAAYASEAADAFLKAGSPDDAAAARATEAREYRTLYSPDLALASLSEVLALRQGVLPTSSSDSVAGRLDSRALPTMRLLANFTGTFSRREVTHDIDGKAYPAVFISKYPRPSKDAAEQFIESLDQMRDLPIAMSGEEASDVLSYMATTYGIISSRHFGLKGAERSRAKHLFMALGYLGNSLGCRPNSGNAVPLRHGYITLNDVLSSGNLRDMLYF